MIPESTVNVNANICFKEVGHVGYNHYVNICNWVNVDVPWGPLDWAGFIVVATLITLAVALVLTLVVAIIKDQLWD